MKEEELAECIVSMTSSLQRLANIMEVLVDIIEGEVTLHREPKKSEH